MSSPRDSPRGDPPFISPLSQPKGRVGGQVHQGLRSSQEPRQAGKIPGRGNRGTSALQESTSLTALISPHGGQESPVPFGSAALGASRGKTAKQDAPQVQRQSTPSFGSVPTERTHFAAAGPSHDYHSIEAGLGNPTATDRPSNAFKLKLPEKPDPNGGSLTPRTARALGDEIGSWGLVISIIKIIIGKGMLAHAYAYRLIGYGMFYLDCVVFATSYVETLVLFYSLKDGDRSIWDAIHRSLGRDGVKYWQAVIFLGRSCTLVMTLHVMGGCVKEVLHVPVPIETIEPGFYEQAFHPTRILILLFCALCCCGPMLSKMYSTLQYFNALGVAACASIFVVFLHVYRSEVALKNDVPHDGASVYNLPLVVGMSMFVSGGGDPAIGDIFLRYTKCRPSSYSIVDIAAKVACAFLIGFIVVVGLSMGCYQMYGSATEANVLHNLARDPAQQSYLSPVLVLLFLNGLCSYGLLGNVIFLGVEDDYKITGSWFRLSMLSIYFVAAVLIPNMVAILTFAGCFIHGQYKFILPPLLYIKRPSHLRSGNLPDGEPGTPRRYDAEVWLLYGTSCVLLLIGSGLFCIGAMRVFI